MIKYNAKLVPYSFGLVNNGVLCYLNSLIQSLISLPRFLQALEDLAKSGNLMSKAILDVAHEKTDNTFEIMKLISNKISPNRQQDAQETLFAILELLDKVEEIFQIRYETTIDCTCGYSRVLRREQPEIYINFTEYMDNTEDFQQIIKSRSCRVADYKCEKCNRTGFCTTTQKLRRLSEIICVAFTMKYIEKHKQYFPPKMSFASKTGILNYKLVAKIDHFGTMSGGHYTSTCLRRSTQASSDKSLESLLSTYNTTKDQNIKDICKDRIMTIKQNICSVELNDSFIKYSNLIPVPETYMVFYELY